MASNPTGFVPTNNVAKQVAQAHSQRSNPDARPQNAAQQGQGPRAAAFANATAPTATAAAPAAPAAPAATPAAIAVGGTTSPRGQTAAPPGNLATALIANAKLAVSLAGQLIVMNPGLAAVAVTATGETKDSNKDKANKEINRATRVGDESIMALKQTDNSAMGGDVDSANGASQGANATTA